MDLVTPIDMHNECGWRFLWGILWPRSVGIPLMHPTYDICNCTNLITLQCADLHILPGHRCASSGQGRVYASRPRIWPNGDTSRKLAWVEREENES